VLVSALEMRSLYVFKDVFWQTALRGIIDSKRLFPLLANRPWASLP
jgi:hypothetical protein